MTRNRLAFACALLLGVGTTCSIPLTLEFMSPQSGQLTLAGQVILALSLPDDGVVATLEVRIDGALVNGQLPAPVTGLPLVGKVSVPAVGTHLAEATIQLKGGGAQSTSATFETIALDNPDVCEILNNAECLLPYPSSRFERPDPTTATGVRLAVPAYGLPTLIGPALSPAPYNELDGWSPTPQITMHFPGGVDLGLSGAAVLQPAGVPQSPPFDGIRMPNGRSLDSDSPTLLIDADSGEHIFHWVELDAHANGNPARQSLVIRVGRPLKAGGHYLVAVRGLRHADNSLVQAEPAFAALRDDRVTDIAAIRERRTYGFVTNVLDRLTTLGVSVPDLQLAFDFHVQSQSQQTRQMLAMRDQAYAWITSQLAVPGTQLFTVTSTQTNDCTSPTVHIWRRIAGTYLSPLFLTAVPTNTGAPQHSVDANDIPVQNGTMNAAFTISVPCSVLDPGGPALYPLVLGHGLFGRGTDMIDGVPIQVTNALADPNSGVTGTWRYIAGATDWRGLSNQDLIWVAQNIIGFTDNQLNNFPAFPDRLRQGMLNTLVLARLMKLGHFNVHPSFQTPDARPVFPGPSAEEYYYGISLGGIMGTYMAGLTPDIEKFDVDVSAIDFNLLLQRSTQFNTFELLIQGIGLTDPMKELLGLGLQHELWVSAEPASVASHITGLVDPPLPGVGAKKILMSVAWLDKQVSNQAAELEARSLGIGNLEGSLLTGFQGIPNVTGPQSSAMQVWSTGSFDVWNPAHQQYIPPLANLIPSNVCDPHTARPSIPASVQQMLDFLQPGGVITNKCTGTCDAGIRFEQPSAGVCIPPP
jgi:hypothetical protein